MPFHAQMRNTNNLFCQPKWHSAINMKRQVKYQPKLVQVLTNKLKTLDDKSKNPKDRLDIVEDVFYELISNLSTFGPILQIIHEEYLSHLIMLKRNILIEETLRIK